MRANSPVEIGLFDLVDEFARQVKAGNPKPSQVVAARDTIVVFCESLFDQLLAQVLGTAISGFGPESKRKAAAAAARQRGPLATSSSLRALVALFESFCDMYQEVVEGSYGAAEITYARFHDRYLSRLLERIGAWAREVPYQDLADRIALAQLVYADAIGAMRW